jgi:hypothetical protein
MAFFWYLLGLCVNNAHKIYNDINPGHVTLPSFIHQLIVEWREIVGKGCGAQARSSHRLIFVLSNPDAKSAKV